MANETAELLDWIDVLIADQKCHLRNRITFEQQKARPMGSNRDADLAWRKGFLSGLTSGLESLSKMSTSIGEWREFNFATTFQLDRAEWERQPKN